MSYTYELELDRDERNADLTDPNPGYVVYNNNTFIPGISSDPEFLSIQGDTFNDLGRPAKILVTVSAV